MLEQDAGCIVFERRVGQSYICVKILLYSAILFPFKLTDHVITAKCPYDEIPGIFKRGNPFSGERCGKEILCIR